MTHSSIFPALCVAAILMFAPGSGDAHPGHDDGPEPVATAGAPRTEAHSDDFELVATASDPHALKIWLDRFATNEPLPGGSVEVADGGGDAVRAEPQDDGTYILRAPWLDVPGKHDLTFTVAAGDAADLLTAMIELPQAGHAAATASSGGRVREMLGDRAGPVTVALAFLLGVLTVVAVQARGKWRAVSGATAILVGVAIGGVAFAHGGVDDGDAPAPAAAATGNAPRRQTDGSVSMPKDAQRLLAVRTVLSAETKASRTVQIMGQVIADPSASGRVQPSQAGRIEPGEKGLAHVGQRVQAGDILAVVAPAIAAVERGTVGSQVADVDQQVRLAEQKVGRLSGLAGSVPGKDIDDARTELAGARARRAALSPTLAGRETLRAPVSGVVSVANAVAGQYVEGKDIVFEIVDPTRLWVDATAFDPALAAGIKGASALTADGRPLTVELVGQGLSLRQGAVPLQFRITAPPAGLSVGTPVTVIASVPPGFSGEATGVALPRSAVVRMPNGGSAVWDHVSAERFVPRPVRMQPLDGANVLVLAGVKAGSRIVTQGAELLNQVR